MSAYVQHKGIDMMDLLDPSKAVAIDVTNALSDCIGLSWDDLAFYVITSFCGLLTSQDVLNVTIDNLASVLWLTLGDPETGGEEPPSIYKEAAVKVYALFVESLNPTGAAL